MVPTDAQSVEAQQQFLGSFSVFSPFPVRKLTVYSPTYLRLSLFVTSTGTYYHLLQKITQMKHASLHMMMKQPK